MHNAKSKWRLLALVMPIVAIAIAVAFLSGGFFRGDTAGAETPVNPKKFTFVNDTGVLASDLDVGFKKVDFPQAILLSATVQQDPETCPTPVVTVVGSHVVVVWGEKCVHPGEHVVLSVSDVDDKAQLWVKSVTWTNAGTPIPTKIPDTGNLSGVYDINVEIAPTIGLYTCIARLDHDLDTDEAKIAAVCNADQDIGDPNNPLPDLQGEGPPGDDGAPGPPPPPPYISLAPTKLNGDVVGGTLTLRGCFEDVGGTLGPNILVVVVIPDAKTQLTNDGEMVGSLYLYANADGRKIPKTDHPPTSQCGSKIPTGDEPNPLPVTLHNIKSDPGTAPWRTPGDQDFDDDTCTDFEELAKTREFKCGDDPYNPYDSGTAMNDISGSYSMTAIAVYENWVADESQPGIYYNCLADIQQTDDGKDDGEVVARLLCYIDNPLLPVNPEAGLKGGNGSPGAAPPPPYADIDSKHTELTGYIDNDKNTLELKGCFQDTDGFGALGYVYVETVGLNVHTLQGQVYIWSGSTAANCTGGTPKGEPARADLRLARQALKSANRDTDGDGCPDKNELSDAQGDGGLRDPSNKWDYFNPTNDGRNRSDDILLIVNHYRDDDWPPDGGYDVKYDRTGVAGSNDWNFGPPNGSIRSADILAAVKSYRHDCGTGGVVPKKPTPWPTPGPWPPA